MNSNHRYLHLAAGGISCLIVGILLGRNVAPVQAPVPAPAVHQVSDGTMMESDGSLNQALAGKTGDAFDSAFLSEMIVHHQGAVTMAEQVLKTSKRPELIALAKNVIAAQTKEIAQMQGWQKEWFAKK